MNTRKSLIVICTETLVAAPADRCFDLARSVDAHAASATLICGKAVGGKQTGLAGAGDETTWSARFFCHFGHRYTFESLGPKQTRLRDEFFFESPWGPLGLLADRVLLYPRMRTVAHARVQFLKRAAESEEWRQYLADAAPSRI